MLLYYLLGVLGFVVLLLVIHVTLIERELKRIKKSIKEGAQT